MPKNKTSTMIDNFINLTNYYVVSITLDNAFKPGLRSIKNLRQVYSLRSILSSLIFLTMSCNRKWTSFNPMRASISPFIVWPVTYRNRKIMMFCFSVVLYNICLKNHVTYHVGLCLSSVL